MSDQFGFDFGDHSAPAFTEQTAGAWNAPDFTTAQYVALFAKADAAVRGIVGPGRVLLAQGLEAAKAQHAAMLAHRARDAGDAYRLWRSNFQPAPAELEAFIAHCFAHAGTNYHGIEYKIRRQARMTTVAMFARDVGTVIVHQWAGTGTGVDYYPWRDTFFLDSYRDDLPAIFAPYASWAVAYCADKIAASNDGIASVPTFVLNGREYINDGGCGKGSYQECEGWTFRPLSDWRGPTYSYRTQCQAWDDGRTERGDRRGLVVSVRGQRCVLDGVALVYDDNATETVSLPAGDDEADIEVDDLDEAGEFDELAA
ncbi:MAG: hypothetical protein FHK80_03470 [Azoarcus sp. PHD]|nr:MAG: hypothetical protein FHK80_03470 [Azoarcus sp. PHD]